MFYNFEGAAEPNIDFHSIDRYFTPYPYDPAGLDSIDDNWALIDRFMRLANKPQSSQIAFFLDTRLCIKEYIEFNTNRRTYPLIADRLFDLAYLRGWRYFAIVDGNPYNDPSGKYTDELPFANRVRYLTQTRSERQGRRKVDVKGSLENRDVTLIDLLRIVEYNEEGNPEKLYSIEASHFHVAAGFIRLCNAVSENGDHRTQFKDSDWPDEFKWMGLER